MIKLKKILYFIAGSIVIPFILAAFFTLVFGVNAFQRLSSFFGTVFLISYLLFPVLYKKDMPKRFPNRYVFYGVLYLGLSLLFVVLIVTIALLK